MKKPWNSWKKNVKFMEKKEIHGKQREIHGKKREIHGKQLGIHEKNVKFMKKM